jgi:hypothetical protein
LYRDNEGSLHAGLKDAIEQVMASVDADLIAVSDKFKPQIINMLELEPDVEKISSYRSEL